MKSSEIGFGGSCHWCAEAVFLSLKGVNEVKQGWIACREEPERFSEAVIVHFEPSILPLDTLLAIHLHTHSCTSNHGMREKYRSAVYTFSREQQLLVSEIIHRLQAAFNEPIITEVVPFGSFKLNHPQYLNYYYADPEKPFCQNIVNPKLLQLMRDFKEEVDTEKLAHLGQVKVSDKPLKN